MESQIKKVYRASPSSLFITHLTKHNDYYWEGWVYLANGDEKEYDYLCSEKEEELLKFDKEKARCMMSFSIRWRGQWDNRVYFNDDEYRGYELEQMFVFWKRIEMDLQIRIQDKK